jgi:ABC-type transporter MlaC component
MKKSTLLLAVALLGMTVICGCQDQDSNTHPVLTQEQVDKSIATIENNQGMSPEQKKKAEDGIRNAFTISQQRQCIDPTGKKMPNCTPQ